MIYARVRMLYLLSIMLKLKIRQIRRRKEWETCEDKLEDMVELDRGCFGVVFCAKHDGNFKINFDFLDRVISFMYNSKANF